MVGALVADNVNKISVLLGRLGALVLGLPWCPPGRWPWCWVCPGGQQNHDFVELPGVGAAPPPLGLAARWLRPAPRRRWSAASALAQLGTDAAGPALCAGGAGAPAAHPPPGGTSWPPRRGDGGQKSTRSGQWKSLPLTRSSAHGRLSLLVTQHGRVVPPEPNMVVPGTPPASPAGSRLQNPKGSSSSGCVTSRGNCCFYQDLVQAPRLGGVPGRGSST